MIKIHGIFVTLLFLRLWWCDKAEILTNLADAGFGHLNERAKGHNTKKEDLVKENIRMREVSQFPPVFPNGWIPILLSSELKRGETKPIFALGQGFAAFRGKNKKVYVLDAFCPHLGANLSVGGRVIENCLECPFHMWRFDGETGNCTHIPYTNKIPAAAKTKSWPCKETNGFIYIWYHSEDSPPSWFIPDIPDIKSGQCAYRGKSEFIIHGHIQDIWENGADVAHFDAMHSGHFKSGEKPGYSSGWRMIKHQWESTWSVSPNPEELHIANMSFTWYPNIFGVPFPSINMKCEGQFIGTAGFYYTTTTPLGSSVLLFGIVPEQPLQHRLISLLYTNVTIPQLLANYILRFSHQTTEQDIEVWQNKKFLHNPALVKEDKQISSFRRWYAQFYSEHSPTLKDIKNKSMDW